MPTVACPLARTGKHIAKIRALQSTLLLWPLHRLVLTPAEPQQLDSLTLESEREVLAPHSVRLDSAIEPLRVRAWRTAEQGSPQAELWTGTNDNGPWSALIVRVGEHGLCGMAPWPDHRPEKAWKWTASAP